MEIEIDLGLVGWEGFFYLLDQCLLLKSYTFQIN